MPDALQPGDPIPKSDLPILPDALDEGEPETVIIPDDEVVPTGSTFDTVTEEEDLESKWHTVAIISKDKLAVVFPGRIEDLPTEKIARMCQIVDDAHRKVFHIETAAAQPIELDKFVFLTPTLVEVVTGKEDSDQFRSDVAKSFCDGAIYKRIARVTRPTQANIEDEK